MKRDLNEPEKSARRERNTDKTARREEEENNYKKGRRSWKRKK